MTLEKPVVLSVTIDVIKRTENEIFEGSSKKKIVLQLRNRITLALNN